MTHKAVAADVLAWGLRSAAGRAELANRGNRGLPGPPSDPRTSVLRETDPSVADRGCRPAPAGRDGHDG